MYSSYSQVSKYSPAGQRKMRQRKGKSCGYYLRVIFFFSSLIQTLIIVSLVLFLIYGKQQDSASTVRIQDLEQSFSQLSIENVGLRLQRKNLTNFLNVTLTEKARIEWDLIQMQATANMSYFFLMDLNKKLNQCNIERLSSKLTLGDSGLRRMPTMPGHCGLQVDQLRAMVEHLQSNFTQTTQIMRMEKEEITKDRDKKSLEAIQLRRDNSVLQRNLADFKEKCREQLSLPLSGLSNVSRALLEKIDSLFPIHLAFQLTCQKQRENLEQIRTNCTNLSREVENRLQVYLNKVQVEMLDTMSENSQLRAENWRMTQDYLKCSQNRTAIIQEHKESVKKVQVMHDDEIFKLLREKTKLEGDKNVLTSSINLRDKQIAHLNEQLSHLNNTCMIKANAGSFLGAGGIPSFGTNTQSQPGSVWNRLNSGGSSSSSSSSSSSGNSFGRTGLSTSLSSTGTGLSKWGSSTGSSSIGSKSSSTSLSSTGLGLNKPATSGTGTSSSFGSSSRTGTNSGTSLFGLNKPASTNTGLSSSGSLGSSSSSGTSLFGSNKPASTNTGLSSSGSLGSSSNSGTSLFGLNKPASTNTGLSSSGSLGSSSNSGTSLLGQSKPATSSKTSSTSGATSGSTTASKSNSGFSLWSAFGSKSGTGTGTGKTGGSSGGTGTTFGAGKTSGLVAGDATGQVSMLQHMQNLQRIVNHANSEDNQDLSRGLLG